MEKRVSLQHRLEGFGYHMVEKLVASLPDATLPAVARSFAFLIFTLLRIRRNVTQENLKRAFPHKTELWRKQIAYHSYLHFCLMILEFMKMNHWSVSQLKRRLQKTKIENLLNALANQHSAIIVSGHFGNWEIGIGYLDQIGIASTVIQQRQKNPIINHKMKVLREKWGTEIVYTRGAVQNCEKAIHKGRLVALLGDQDAGDRGVFVPFFGRLSSTHIGAAVLQINTGVRIFLGVCVRLTATRFELKMIEIPGQHQAQLSDTSIERLTGNIMRALEKEIRKRPSQYFWMHRRWKTPPP